MVCSWTNRLFAKVVSRQSIRVERTSTTSLYESVNALPSCRTRALGRLECFWHLPTPVFKAFTAHLVSSTTVQRPFRYAGALQLLCQNGLWSVVLETRCAVKALKTGVGKCQKHSKRPSPRVRHEGSAL